jgi:hypothetical protein
MHYIVEAAENPSGQWQEFESGVRQHHWSAPSLEQGGAEYFLEMMDLGADRRLREIQCVGGGGELMLYRHCDEAPQLLDRETTSTLNR